MPEVEKTERVEEILASMTFKGSRLSDEQLRDLCRPWVVAVVEMGLDVEDLPEST